jgi:hypothetical protein
MRFTTLGLLAALTLTFVPSIRAAEDDFTPLIRGNDPGQFEVVGLGKGSLMIKNGEVRLAGKQHGYFATRTGYKNYVLRFEWMYEKHHGKPSDGNSGLMVHVQGKPQVWPRSIEVQIWYKDFGSFYTHRGARFNPKKDDRKARDRTLKPPGQWNVQEVTCQDGSIRLKVNGVEYAAGVNANPDHGRIGWMFEGSPIRFRNLKIKKLD